MNSRSSGTDELNPLLDASGLPRFDAILPEHVGPAMNSLLEQLEAELSTLEASLETVQAADSPRSRPSTNRTSTTWDDLIVPLERIGDRLGFPWVATTLTVSPRKPAGAINAIGVSVAANAHTCYLESDFKKQDGFKRSCELSKSYNLFRQNYCGCLYSLRDRDAL